jgi:hypothetical protein
VPQQTTKDFSVYMMGNLCSDWLLITIDKILAEFGPKNNSKVLPAES